MDDGPCGERDGDAGSGERERQGSQVAREQPRQRSRRKCWTCGGVCKYARGMGKRARQGEAGEGAFCGEGEERGRDSRL